MCRYKEDADRLLHEATFDKYSLPDLSSFSVSCTTDPSEKFTQFLSYVKNPYLFRVGDIGVHVSFSGNQVKLYRTQCLKSYPQIFDLPPVM